jgi:hypothetical protein
VTAMRIVTERPVFWWLARLVYASTRHRYTLTRYFNTKHHPRLGLQGCQCTPGHPHPCHQGQPPQRTEQAALGQVEREEAP